jgi:hypothetical protein
MKRFWWLKLGVPVVLLIGVVLTISLQGDGPLTAGSAMAEERARPKMLWDNVSTNISAYHVRRTRVPGGWFVHIRDDSYPQRRDQPVSVGGAFFYPDPRHEWDGSSQPR